MNNLKNKKLIIAISLILVLTISSVGGYYGYQYYQDSNKKESEQDKDTYNPDENTNPNPPNPDLDGNETEEWLTYTDPDFGFSFEYPKDWKISDNVLQRDNYSLKTLKIAGQKLKLLIFIHEDKENTYSGNTLIDKSYVDSTKLIITKDGTILFRGDINPYKNKPDSMELFTNFGSNEDDIYTTYIKKEQVLYQVRIDFNNKKEPDSVEEEVLIIDKILETINFI